MINIKTKKKRGTKKQIVNEASTGLNHEVRHERNKTKKKGKTRSIMCSPELSNVAELIVRTYFFFQSIYLFLVTILKLFARNDMQLMKHFSPVK